jgi:hypothetical protein
MKARKLPLFYGSRMFMQILENDNFMALCFLPPVMVAERSEACTVFARSEAGIVSLDPTQGIDV